MEDAAHKTRIHANSIRGLENDDYSGFANIIYAKSFLSLYSRFLEVDATAVLAQFSSGKSAPPAGNGRTFLQPVGERIESGSRSSMYPSRRTTETTSPGGTPVLLGLVLLLLLIAIPTLWYLGKDAESPEEVGTKIKELTNAGLEENNPAAPGGQAGDKPLSPPPGETPPAKPGTLHAKPISPGALSDPSSGEPSPNAASPPGGRSTMEFDLRNREPLSTPEKTPADEGASGPNGEKPPAPIRATPLIARPMVIPDPEAAENAEAETNPPDSETSGDDDRKNHYPRPE